MPCKNLPSSKFLNFSEIFFYLCINIFKVLSLNTSFSTAFYTSGRNIRGQFHTKDNIGGKVFAAQ